MSKKSTVRDFLQYHAEMENLSNVYGPVSRSSLIMTIQRESRQLQALERENKELLTALDDHQTAIELIMSKYRMQVSQLIQLHQRDVLERKNTNEVGSRNNTILESELIKAHSNKVMEMASVMKRAAEIDEENDCLQKVVISQLRTENRGLREMLLIAKKSGSLSSGEDQNTVRRRTAQVITSDKEVQTEIDLKSNDQKSGDSPKLDEASEVTE